MPNNIEISWRMSQVVLIHIADCHSEFNTREEVDRIIANLTEARDKAFGPLVGKFWR